MVTTLDPFAIDASAEITRGTDAEFIAYMRTTSDGHPVVGASGLLHIRRGGCTLDTSPYDVPADADRGDGFMSLIIDGADVMPRGYYTWVFVAESPGGGQARAEGRFRLE